MALLVSGVEWSDSDEVAREAVAAALGLEAGSVLRCDLVKKSLDARRKRKRWVANYRVEVSVPEEPLAGRHGVRLWNARDDERTGRVDPTRARRQTWPSDVRPVVVGAGPAGLFAALRLAEAGAPVLLVERGAGVEERINTVNRFWRRREGLNPSTNVVYGEGGAGTFSDGKIYTRRRDGALGYVFQRLVDFGADASILTDGWAHLGTDRVRAMLPAFRARLQELGVEVAYGVAMTGLLTEGGRCVGVELSDGRVLRRAPVIVAAGHSARDTYEALVAAGAAAEARAIAIGCRIEHPQDLIDRARYQGERGELPPASYRLAWHPPTGRKAHTFCMCPGGIVVPATNHPERVVVNGMSFSARKAWWANSAVIVEVQPSEYPGTDPLAGLRYQDRIEKAAYELGGRDYTAPAQMVVDLLADRESRELPRTSYPHGIAPVDLREVLPPGIVAGLKKAVRQFDRKVPGFAGPEALLIAPETRTTSPLRFLRDERLESTTLPGLLPVGEGAGYAGGIASAALDGVRAASCLVERYAPRLT